MRTDQSHQLEILDETECVRLLSTAVIGRLAYTEDALPAIQPLSFAVHDGQVVIPTRAGTKVAAASRGAVVAFEADAFDPASRTGWNVTVVGPSRVVSAPEEIAALDLLDLHPWAPALAPPGTSCYISVAMSIIRGRRIGLSTPVLASGIPS